MPLDQINNTLEKSRSGSTVTLSASDFPSVQDLFTNFFNTDTLVLTAASTNNTNGKVSVEGTLNTPWFDIPNLRASCTFTVVRDQTRLVIVLTGFPADWTFDDSFKKLTGSAITAFQFNQPAFTIDSGYPDKVPTRLREKLGMNPLPKAAKGIAKKGLSFRGQLLFDQLPAMVRIFMNKQPQDVLNVSGAIELIDETPRFLLSSEETWDYQLMGTTHPIRLQFYSLLSGGDKARQTGYPQSYLAFSSEKQIVLKGQSLNLPMVAYVASETSARLTFTIMAPANTPIGLDDLPQLIGFKNAGDHFPASFPSLTSLSFRQLSFELNTLTFDLEKATVQIQWDHNWPLFGDKIKLSGFLLQFTARAPTTTDPYFVVTAFFKATFGSLSLEGSIGLPDFFIAAYLPQGQEINIKSFLKKETGLALSEFPAMTCSQLYLDADIPNKSFALSATLKESLDAGNGLSITLTALKAIISHSSGNSQFSIEAIADLNQLLPQTGASLQETGIDVRATYDNTQGWQLDGFTLPGQKISLTLLLGHLTQKFGTQLNGYLPDAYAENMRLGYASAQQLITFSGTISSGKTARITLLGQPFEVDFYINLQIRSGKTTGTLNGLFKLADQIFGLEYDITQASKKLIAVWQGQPADATAGQQSTYLTLEEIISDLGLPAPNIPGNYDFKLTAVSFQYDITTESLTLAARTAQYGTAFIQAGKFAGEWGYVLGVELTANDLKQIPGIGEAIDILQVNEATLLVSSAADPTFTLPEIPSLDGSLTTPISTMLGQNVFALRPGFAAVLDIDFSQSSDKILQATGRVIGTDQLTAMLSVGSSGLSVEAAISGGVVIGSGKNKLKLQNAALTLLLAEEITAEISCITSITLKHKRLDAIGSLDINESSLAGTFNIKADQGSIPNLLGLPGLHLQDIGFSLNVEFEPPAIGMGIEAAFTIGSGSTTVQYNSDNAYDKFVLVLTFEEEVPNPSYASFYVKQASLGEVITIFTNKNSPALYNVVQADDLSFYWADEMVILPDNTAAQPGFGFSARLDIFGFKAFAELEVKISEGIHGIAQMDPVRLQDIFSVTGNSSTFYRNYKGNKMVPNTPNAPTKGVQKKVWVAGGGPVMEISSKGPRFVYADWKITLFNLVSEQLEVLLDKRGATFELKDQLANVADFTIDCTLQFSKGFSLSGNADFTLKLDMDLKIPGVDKIPGLGTIRLDCDMDANLSLLVNEQEIVMKASGEFEFDGRSLSLPEFTIDVNYSQFSFRQLPDILIRELKDKADEIFKDMLGGLAKAWEDVEKGAEDIKNGAEAAGKAIAKEATTTASDITKGTEAVAKHTVADINKASQAVAGATQSIINSGAQAVSTIRNEEAATVNQINAWGNEAKQKAEQTISKTKKDAEEFVAHASATISHLSNELDNDISAAENDVANAARKTINTLKNTFKSFEKDTEKAIHQLEHAGEVLLGAANKALASITSQLDNVGKDLANVGKDIVKLKNALTSAYAAVGAAANKDFKAVKKYLGKISDSIKDLGGDLSSELGNIGSSIKNTLSNVGHAVNHVLSSGLHKISHGLSSGWHHVKHIFHI